MSIGRFLSTKHIPTLLGLAILGAGLVGGILFVNNSNTNSFLPRASPETTPKNLKVTNVFDTSVSVSWVTDSKTPGYVRFGTSANNLTQTITDDRDQITGTVGLFRTHHVTLRSLSPNTTYYFKVGTGTRELYDDGGKPYTITTAASGTNASRTLYGEVGNESGVPVPGTLIYVSSDGLAPLSALAQSTGSWVISLAKARTPDLKNLAKLDNSATLNYLVIDGNTAQSTSFTASLEQSQPLPRIVSGKGITTASSAPAARATPVPENVQSKFSSVLLGPPTEEGGSTTLSITNPASNGEIITSTTPQLMGRSAPNASIRISLRQTSTQTVTVTAGSSGSWSYTPKTALKNGTATLTVTTTINGQQQTSTRTFIVDTTKSSSIPSFVASGSARATTTPQATTRPTTRPRATATPIPEETQEPDPLDATDSADIKSGTMTFTIMLLFISMLSLFAGVYIFALNK